MAVQQRRVSKRRCRQRKAANRYRGVAANGCPQCGAPRMPHRACKACGFYRERQVLTVESD